MRVTILRAGQPLGNGDVISPAILGSLAMQEHPVPVVNPSPRWEPNPPAIGWAHDFRVEGDALTAEVDGALPRAAELFTCSISYAVDPETGAQLGARLVDVCTKSHPSATRRGGETL